MNNFQGRMEQVVAQAASSLLLRMVGYEWSWLLAYELSSYWEDPTMVYTKC
jgi:hypothetical protein